MQAHLKALPLKSGQCFSRLAMDIPVPLSFACPQPSRPALSDAGMSANLEHAGLTGRRRALSCIFSSYVWPCEEITIAGIPILSSLFIRSPFFLSSLVRWLEDVPCTRVHSCETFLYPSMFGKVRWGKLRKIVV